MKPITREDGTQKTVEQLKEELAAYDKNNFYYSVAAYWELINGNYHAGDQAWSVEGVNEKINYGMVMEEFEKDCKDLTSMTTTPEGEKAVAKLIAKYKAALAKIDKNDALRPEQKEAKKFFTVKQFKLLKTYLGMVTEKNDVEDLRYTAPWYQGRSGGIDLNDKAMWEVIELLLADKSKLTNVDFFHELVDLDKKKDKAATLDELEAE